MTLVASHLLTVEDYARLPDLGQPTELVRGRIVELKYLEKVPDLVVEVLSESDRWSALLTKVAEYLDAGVTAVCILDPLDETAYVYHGDRPVRILTATQEFALPDMLGDFRVQVAEFFR